MGYRSNRRQEPGCAELITGALFLVGLYIFFRPHDVGVFLASFNPVVLIALTALIVLALGLTTAVLIRRVQFKHAQKLQNEADRRWQLQSTDLARFSPDEFEDEVAWVLSNAGGGRAERVGGRGDRGVDVKFYRNDGRFNVIQVKHRRNQNDIIPPNIVREMDSVAKRFGAVHGYIITNATFSSATWEIAREYGIGLLDGAGFEKLRHQAYERFHQTADQSNQPPPLAPELPIGTTPTTNVIDLQLAERKRRLDAAGK